jgi:hypothetical protein
MPPSLLLAALVLAAPTYPDVEPILRHRCCGCHQRGRAGPMSLGTYREAADRGESIREAVEDGRMPPWHADPRYGRWANDRRLTAAERQTLLDWIEGGCAQGRPVARENLPADPTGWRIRPGVVIEMPEEQAISPAGQVPYRFVTVPTGFKEDVWVSAAEIRPGNRKVVHHVLVFAPLDIPGIAIDNGMLASYLPGDEPLELPAGYAKRIPAGTPLTFQMHYTPTGKPETDRTAIGLVLAKGPPRCEVRTVHVEPGSFLIPAGAPDHRLDGSRAICERTELLSLTPHMHLRGKDFKYELVHPDGKSETLLSVPKYDFNWQTTYRFAEPRTLPAGSRIDCTAHYDNSAANPNNPDPARDVPMGENVADEMMLGFVDYVVSPQPRAMPRKSAGPAARPSPAPWLASGTALLAAALAARLWRRSNAAPR